ncbi:hypothetical protein EKO27_g4958 [Xylaria grammica]|uniref:Uncharacterized protein n=1 Tax=Xylaria grammica TaxID=363999 RepID=A0A439D6U8_9PEZI|nr:hypothetical protein EKO27_g4958 [Xylaria grammica]
MQTAHGHTWECRAPSHDPIVFNQEIQYQEHSIKEHGVPKAHTGTLSNAARRPVLDKVLECPFGDDFQPSGKVESSAVFSSEALQSHVAGHMKEIALLTLQKLPSDGDENAENVDSDQPLEDDGPAGAFGITRASMYSVLDDEDLDFQDDDAEAVEGNVGHRGEDISARVTVLDLEDKDNLGMTRLHDAVQAGDLGLVESLIQSGASVNFRDENGQTPLHYAAERGLIECMEVLVKHSAALHIIDTSGFSPFLWAVVAGQEGATTGLLSMDADANSFSADGKSALAWAASLGWSLTAKMLVEHRASISDTRNTQQTLPLEEAAASGNLPTVRLLLECGEGPNHRDRDGWSAIHWAAEEGHLEIVRLLLGAGRWGQPQCCQLLRYVAITQKATGNLAFSKSRCCRAVTSLRQAVTIGNVPMIKLLFKLGHDINGTNSGRRTALYYAAKKRMLSIMDLLLDLSADPNILPAGRKN